MKINKIDKLGMQLIAKFEGCKLEAYKCPAGVWTIGYGNTYYENGDKIKKGDKITQDRANELFYNLVTHYEKGVDSMTRDDITQNMFNALVSFAWNLGLANLKSSTLLKKVNKDPNDKTIGSEFNKWCKADNKVLKGLVLRRTAEWEMYCKK